MTLKRGPLARPQFRVIPTVEVLNRRDPFAAFIRWGRWTWYYRNRMIR